MNRRFDIRLRILYTFVGGPATKLNSRPNSLTSSFQYPTSSFSRSKIGGKSTAVAPALLARVMRAVSSNDIRPGPQNQIEVIGKNHHPEQVPPKKNFRLPSVTIRIEPSPYGQINFTPQNECHLPPQHLRVPLCSPLLAFFALLPSWTRYVGYIGIFPFGGCPPKMLQ